MDRITNVSYSNDIFKLINQNLTDELCMYIESSFEQCDIPSKIAFVLDDEFNVIEERISSNISFSYGNIYEFSNLLASLAKKIKWN